MMLFEISTLLAFSLVAFMLVITPGPDTMLILHRSTAGGISLGMATVAGVQAGLVCHTLLAIFGLSALIASSPLMFKGVALAGSLYLIWLAIQNMRGSKKAGVLIKDSEKSLLNAFRDSMLCNLLNPKVILIYLALMPNFVILEFGNVKSQLLILGALLILINTVWQVPLCLAAFSANKYLKNPTVQKYIDWSAGCILMMFAVAMFYENIIQR